MFITAAVSSTESPSKKRSSTTRAGRSLRDSSAVSAAPLSVWTTCTRKREPAQDFVQVVDKLNQPTSLEFIGNTAYVVNLAGEIVKIDNVSGPPFGVSH